MNEMDLLGKRAVVCGSTQGIGKSTAIKLAEMGASIVLISRNIEKLNRVLSELPIVDQNQNHEAISSKCFEFVSKRVVLDRGIQRKRSIRTSYRGRVYCDVSQR